MKVLKNKKTHKLSRMFHKLYGWKVRPLCKVDNKTYAYNKTTYWKSVDCEKCLEKKMKAQVSE